MTKNEQKNLEALKVAFEFNEWEDFLLVLNEIRQRDKDIIAMYRQGCKDLTRLQNASKNAINELELINGNTDIAIAELKKGMAKEEKIIIP